MTPQTADDYFPEDTYRLPWTIFWLAAIASGILIWLSFFRPDPVPPPPRAAISAGYDWFFVLHMPEVPRDPVQTQKVQARFGEWLGALANAGYQPMLLTDVQKRIQEGVGLPERAVVIAFDPGYDHSYESLSPILVQYRFPALWVTDRTAVLRGDRHYVHQRKARRMVGSGYWDLGYSGGGFWKKVHGAKDIKINGTLSTEWAAQAGRSALNWSGDLSQLERLDINPKWTADELLDRLAMELPLQGTVGLSVKPIQGRWWGVVTDSPSKENTFSLQTPLTATSSTLYWLGTKGAADVQLHMTLSSFFGQNFLWLRSDTKTGQGVGIGFSRKRIFVDQKINGTRRRLASRPWSPPGAIQGRVVLVGSQLNVAMVGAKPFEVTLLPDVSSRNGLVRLEIYDRVRGAGRADSVLLELTVLKQAPQSSSR